MKAYFVKTQPDSLFSFWVKSVKSVDSVYYANSKAHLKRILTKINIAYLESSIEEI